MKADADKDGLPFRLNGVTDGCGTVWRRTSPTRLNLASAGDQFDYIYPVDKLQPLGQEAPRQAQPYQTGFLRPTTGGLNPSPWTICPTPLRDEPAVETDHRTGREDNQSLDQEGRR